MKHNHSSWSEYNFLMTLTLAHISADKGWCIDHHMSRKSFCVCVCWGGGGTLATDLKVGYTVMYRSWEVCKVVGFNVVPDSLPDAFLCYL